MPRFVSHQFPTVAPSSKHHVWCHCAIWCGNWPCSASDRRALISTYFEPTVPCSHPCTGCTLLAHHLDCELPTHSTGVSEQDARGQMDHFSGTFASASGQGDCPHVIQNGELSRIRTKNGGNCALELPVELVQEAHTRRGWSGTGDFPAAFLLLRTLGRA